MKISKLFHWLYASLMFLPLFVIPLLCVYSHRHTIEDYTAVLPQYEVVYFNQLNNNEFRQFDNEVSNGITFNSVDVHTIHINGTNTSNVDYSLGNFNINLIGNHKYYVKTYYVNDNNKSYLDFRYKINDVDYSYYGIDSHILFEPQYDCWAYTQYFFIYNTTETININLTTQIFDFTQMFGTGNEPTITQFNQWYPNDYYDYTLSDKQLLNLGTEVLNSTDLGSQYVYATYNVVNNYFNFGNIFNFNAIYEWFAIVIFNGSIPLAFYIFFDLLIYWLFISMFWLVFDLLMYLPLLAHQWIDKARIE